MWRNVCLSNSSAQTAATETRQAFPAFLRDAPESDKERASKGEGQEMRMVPRMHGSPLPDISRPSGFLSHKPDIAPVAELVTEAEDYVRASDPLMAGMGDGKGEPWVPEKFVDAPKLDNILAERGSRYGAFKDNADVSQNVKCAIRRGMNYNRLAVDQLEAIDQIASKLSRIVTGDPDYADNWDDIAGFATLVANRLRGK